MRIQNRILLRLLWLSWLGLFTALLGCKFITNLFSAPASSNADATIAAATALANIPEPTISIPVSSEQNPPAGSIRGILSYPGEFIPPLRVVAIHLETEAAYFIDSVENQTTYQIDGLPPWGLLRDRLYPRRVSRWGLYADDSLWSERQMHRSQPHSRHRSGRTSH